jgi:probable F420-dependent oxidoreductase
VSIRVGIGISAFPFSGPRAFFRWVDLCESSALDSIWQTDRLHSREPFLEALSTMAALAGATERVKFGMNAVVVPFRDPLVLAKQCATIDYLSGGRLLPVFGVGAPRAPEFQSTGRELSARGRRANEALEIMTRLWSEERVSFAGEFYRYEEASIAPRPVQQPLPLWIGGSSPAAIRRTARLGSGWLAGLQTPEQVAPVIAGIKQALVETGRSIDPDHYGAGLPFRFGSWDDPQVERIVAARGRASAAAAVDPRRLYVVGDAAAIVKRCREYVQAGVSKFVLIPLSFDDADLLDQTERLAAEVVPAISSRPSRAERGARAGGLRPPIPR